MTNEEYFNLNPEEFKLKCCICGKYFVPKTYKQYKNLTIKSKKYNRGFFCSDECRISKMRTNIHELNCCNCGKEYYNKRGINDINKPHFCSQSCSAIYYNKKRGYEINEDTFKICLNCNKSFKPRYKKRKFCCKKCETEYKSNQTNKLIENGDCISAKRLRKYFIDNYGKCMNPNCKWNWNDDKEQNPQLELHHIDGNHKNNTLNNCILLCPNCHSLTENYKYKDCHKSTRDRRKYYKKDK